MYKILIIEDDRAIAKAVETNLAAEGYEVETAIDGVSGLERASDPSQDLILLDLMLPKLPGEEICRRLRHNGITTPILFLTAKSEEEHRIAGFELGADDYVAKPFSIRELLGRIQAILRRAAGQKHLLAHYHFADVALDFVKMEARKGDQPVVLTTREFAILRLMVSNKGVVMSRDRLLNEVWGYDAYPTTRTVDNQIVKLRQKLEDDPENPRFILTVRGTGYKFVG
ncbi:MAG: response regulator transcription factor [Acidobacteria bacterium]|nr:response regulator transcription factor [Acidobacteriota bacterium]MCI0722120.1 response regulator transcription factor [Acidobacteriota bacterium]